MSDDAIKLATKLLESDKDYLDNVIGLWRIGNNKYEQCWDTEFHVFGVIESETDHLPLKHVRANCSPDFLAKSDKELAETLEFYRASACNTILNQLKTYNKLINKDKKQLAVFVPQHFSQQFFAHY